MGNEFTITVASGPEDEDLFVEVWYGNYNLAVVENDPVKGDLTIEVYPPPSGNSIILDLEKLRRILEQAEQRMVRMGYPEKR